MARKPGQSPQAIRDRAAKTATAMGSSGGVAAEAPKKKKTSIPQFFREVRAEGRKITWTSRKETWITSVMVAIMVMLAAIFFWIVNSVLNFAITWLLRVSTGA